MCVYQNITSCNLNNFCQSYLKAGKKIVVRCWYSTETQDLALSSRRFLSPTLQSRKCMYVLYLVCSEVRSLQAGWQQLPVACHSGWDACCGWRCQTPDRSIRSHCTICDLWSRLQSSPGGWPARCGPAPRPRSHRSEGSGPWAFLKRFEVSSTLQG